MILKKKSNPSARWDVESNRWMVGESHEYQWRTNSDIAVSPWLNFDHALIWIQEYDINK